MIDSSVSRIPSARGSPITRARTNSKVELNEPLALNPTINDRPTRSISFVANHSYNITTYSCCTIKYKDKSQRNGHCTARFSIGYESMNTERDFYKTKAKRI